MLQASVHAGTTVDLDGSRVAEKSLAGGVPQFPHLVGLKGLSEIKLSFLPYRELRPLNNLAQRGQRL